MKFLSEHSECTVNVEPQYEVVTPSRSDSRQVIGHIQVGGLVRIRAERSLVRYKKTLVGVTDCLRRSPVVPMYIEHCSVYVGMM